MAKARNKEQGKQVADKYKPLRKANGQLLPGYSGNPKGRVKGQGSFMDDFILALHVVEKKQRKPLLEHFLEQAYKDNRVLVSAVDRILPALKAIEMVGANISEMDEVTAKAIQGKLLERFSIGRRNDSNTT